MRIRILAAGRLKDGPERLLIDDYIQRARRTGQPLGVRGVEEIEVEAGGGREKEAERLLAKRSSGGVLIRLDERGEAWTSTDFSKRLTRWREQAIDVDFAIGGADGHGAQLVQASNVALSFGVQTWPHRLVRVMLAEQIYRALSITAGSPYHRE